MNRHERTLLRIGTVLIVAMAALRISHLIGGSAAMALLVFGGLFVAAALVGHNRRLQANNPAQRPGQNDPARR